MILRIVCHQGTSGHAHCRDRGVPWHRGADYVYQPLENVLRLIRHLPQEVVGISVGRIGLAGAMLLGACATTINVEEAADARAAIQQLAEMVQEQCRCPFAEKRMKASAVDDEEGCTDDSASSEGQQISSGQQSLGLDFPTGVDPPTLDELPWPPEPAAVPAPWRWVEATSARVPGRRTTSELGTLGESSKQVSPLPSGSQHGAAARAAVELHAERLLEDPASMRHT